jgi:single-strand DNA-binding protein
MIQGGNVTLVGFVASEPKVHYASGSVPVARMRIGSTPRKMDRETGEWKDGETSFYSVSCWRSLASNSATCLRKGQPVIVAGKLRVSHWENKAGEQRSEVQIEAETIGFDLTRGVAQFSRLRRSPDDGLNFGEAIRSGVAEEPLPGLSGPDESSDNADGGMFDERAIAELDQELDASAAEPAAK